MASAPAPALFLILTMGCPSKEQLQDTALRQAGDGPHGSGQSYLEGAAAGGKQGCVLANPGLASPAGSRRHPNRGMLNQRRAWIAQQVKQKHLPSMDVACRAGHPAEARGGPQVWGSGRAVLLTLTPDKDYPLPPKSWGLEENGKDKTHKRGFDLPAAQGFPWHLCLPGN